MERLRAAALLDRPVPRRSSGGGRVRTIPPAETLARVQPLMARMGITQLGNITGLDRIGIPVAIVVRPNSRSVSVSQGKGLDLPQAMVSALMEACEGFHAEQIGATCVAATAYSPPMGRLLIRPGYAPLSGGSIPSRDLMDRWTGPVAARSLLGTRRDRAYRLHAHR